MGGAKLYRRWKRRFRAGLLSTQSLLAKCLRRGEPDTIHDLRVTLRRTRMLALVGTAFMGRAQAAHFRQWSVNLTSALGPVRDLDVVMEWLNLHAPIPVCDQVLRQDRPRLWTEARSALLNAPPLEWRQLQRGKAGAARPERLVKKFFKARDKLVDSLDETAGGFHGLDEAALHRFRRQLRRLRYLRELELGRRAQKGDRRLAQLIAFQDALGEMLNCSLVRGLFTSDSRLGSPLKVLRLARTQERQWLKRAEKHRSVFRRQIARQHAR